MCVSVVKKKLVACLLRCLEMGIRVSAHLSVSVCVRVRERECVCLKECVRMRERESESVCV